LLALAVGFIFSLAFDHIISAWETMIFVVVTMILVPATMRWHWWRFSAKAFVWSMIASALMIISQKIFFGSISGTNSLGINVAGSFLLTLIIGYLFKPTDKEILIKFYARIRPFGFWSPVRKECIKRQLISSKDYLPAIDGLNGILTAVLQFGLALLAFILWSASQK